MNMENEYKELLLRDTCSRLPYGLIVQYKQKSFCPQGEYTVDVKIEIDDMLHHRLKLLDFKPYLRSVKNMTEKEVKDLVKVKILSKYGKENDYGGLNNIKSIKNFWFSSMHNQWFCDVTFNTIDGKCTQRFSVGRVTWETMIAEIDWLNKNKFDYRGLIPKGIALEAPKDMYNKI